MTLLLHLLLNLYGSHDEGVDPTSDGPLVLLALVLEKLENGPIVAESGPPPNQGLDAYERARERVEAVLSVREGVEVLAEKEFGSGVDGEPGDEVFEVERVAGIGVEHGVDDFLGVPLEEVED